jgi:DnaK suppressor protein
MMNDFYEDCSPSEQEPYMCEQHRSYFRAHLIQWRDSLVHESRRCHIQLHEENRRVPDIIDQVVENTTRNIAYINGQRSLMIIRQIDAALQRIEDGSYGYCLQSEEEIGLRRLLAWPIATLSITAQEEQEHRNSHFQRMAS